MLLKIFLASCLIYLIKGQCFAPTFNLSKDNGALDYAIPWSFAINSIYARSPPIIFRLALQHSNAWFDSIAPYQATAVGHVVRDIARRPSAERTIYNKNVALIYASRKVYRNFYPDYLSRWDLMLTCKGLDPNNTSEDVTTPIGIGNHVGRLVVAHYNSDGMNQLGNEPDRLYNLRPYDDVVTGYTPYNTAEDLKDPGRWQPLKNYNGLGSYTAQTFVTPQWGTLNTISSIDPDDYVSPKPSTTFKYKKDPYKAQADQILNASATLTDYKKVAAEWFDNKQTSLGSIIASESRTRGWTLDQYVWHHFTIQISAENAAIIVWKEKRKWDAARPANAIKYLYENDTITAWGGPGKGTVTNLRGKEWKSYINTGDHPEYPSGSSCFCHAHARAASRWLGSTSFPTGGYTTLATAAKASVIEPGITPQVSTTLGPYSTYTQWAWECAVSRLWGGVHFMNAISASKVLCNPIGDAAYEYVNDLWNGITPADDADAGDDDDDDNSNKNDDDDDDYDN